MLLMPGAGCVLYVECPQLEEITNITIPILKQRKLRLGEVSWWQSQGCPWNTAPTPGS